MRNFKMLSLLSVAFGLITTVPAFADGITLTLTNPFQTIGAGQTVTFDATVTVTPGNTKNIFLNGYNSSITDVGSVFVLNASDFFNNFPLDLTPTGPGDTYTGAIFTITNTGSVTEKYSGDFNLLGGGNSNASKTLATVNFGSPAPTPEPSSVLLLSTGMVGLFLVSRRRLIESLAGNALFQARSPHES